MQNLLFDLSFGPLIFRDLKWVDRSPYLLMESVADASPTGSLHTIALTSAAFLGLDSRASSVEAAGLSTQRYCAGYARAQRDSIGFMTLSCPENSVIEKGKQCPRCLARDEFSAMHGIHRGAQLTPAAESYAALEHWLYVATFPDGSSKVGTASAMSRPRRLDEQAVATATYIARADNGRQVRVWEDLVSQEAGLVQVKTTRSKYRSWITPLSAAQLQEAHEKAVSLAHWTLQEAALFEDFIEESQLISEKWAPSIAMEPAYAFLGTKKRQSLASFDSLLNSAAGFYVLGAVGKFLVAHCGNPDQPLLLNMAELANRAVLPHQKLSESVQVQSPLF